MRRKILAVLLAAAMAISLLAGCGGGKALSQVIVDLLDGLYSNVSVEADSDLTAALKQAAAEGGTEEEILSRMIEILNHNGGSITFTRLGSGQQGDHAVTLYFQTGTDPDAAARNALAQWASVLGTLPDDGSYQGDVAMIEAENGYYIALDVEVLKAGKPDKPDKDDDEPETQEPPEPDKGYTVSEDGKIYSVSNAEGLKAVAKLVNEEWKLDINITLTGNIDLKGIDWTPICPDNSKKYTGTFDGGNHTITGLTVTTDHRYAGLFGQIGPGGTVKNVVLTEVNITSGTFVGGVAGWSFGGNIENCSVSGSVSGSSGSDAGGVVGYQQGGSITGCSSSATVKGTERAGGVVGVTNGGATPLTACYATGDVTVENNGTGNAWAGGIVGMNGTGTLIACYATGNVTGSGSGISIVGGAVGVNYATVTACYWSGLPDNDNGGATKVDGTNVTWDKAVNDPVTGMNAALSGTGWRYELTGGLPTLTQN